MLSTATPKCTSTRRTERYRFWGAEGEKPQGFGIFDPASVAKRNPGLPQGFDAPRIFAPLHPATLATPALKLTPASTCQHKVDKSVNEWLTVILSLTKRAEPCQRQKIPSAYTAARFAGKHKLRSRHSSPAPACSFATNACTFVGKSSSRSGSQQRKRCRHCYPTARPLRHC